MNTVKVALVGVGNCASSLVQGVHLYADPANRANGLMRAEIGGYGPSDLEFVLAIDTDDTIHSLWLTTAAAKLAHWNRRRPDID